MNDKQLVNKQYLLDKTPGKGGWTYTIISEIPPEINTPKRCSFSTRLTKANSIITSSGYMRQRPNKRKWTE